MDYLVAIVAAIAISLALIPAMIRLAPALGMMDKPDPRKVHEIPVPRVGGWGIVIGALAPVILWGPDDPLIYSYIIGAAVLLLFGALDDKLEMGHYTKFVGQFIAVLPVVTYGDLYVSSLPFLGLDEIPHIAGRVFTFFALVGMINAINHSDGLDGLAGGESLLSLGAIAFLAYQVDSHSVILITLVTIGGLLGFLRYNTHPASVFMGDGGSQFLGFTLGFLALLLTQRVDTSLSPAVVFLILGLPIIDIIVVFKKRISQGMNWFAATRNHIHHRFLDLGLEHQETVVIIYSVQALCVVSGIFLRNENDWLILLVYLVICLTLFASLVYLEKSGWSSSDSKRSLGFDNALSVVRHKLLVVAPRQYLDLAIPAFLLIGSARIGDVPRDFGVLAAGVFFLLLFEAFLKKPTRSMVRRVLIYLTIVCVVYLQLDFPRPAILWVTYLKLAFYMFTALAVGLAIRFSPKRRKHEFHTTAMDYLMLFVVVAAMGFSNIQIGGNYISVFVVKLVILLYACELMIIEKRKRWTLLTTSSLIASGMLGIKGLFFS